MAAEGEEERIIPAEEVQVGDVAAGASRGDRAGGRGDLIRPDFINQAVMTGESLPVDKEAGDEVSSGTVNQFGAFEMKASRVGGGQLHPADDPAGAVRGRRKSQNRRAGGPVGYLDCSDRPDGRGFDLGHQRADYPGRHDPGCILPLRPGGWQRPTAIMAAIGNATKHGFLVREGDALERLARVSVITFDKTGTLTCGTPKVIKVHSLRQDLKEEELYGLTASAEQFSEHPLGKAVAASARREKILLFPAEHFQMIPGGGVSADVNGRHVAAGNLKLMAAEGIIPDEEVKKDTEVWLGAGMYGDLYGV